jgi:hypothetical protein
MTSIDVTNISTRNTSAAYYRVITTARTGDTVTANYSGSVSNRVLDVVIYRPASGSALSFDVYGVATTSFTASVTTSAINTAGGGVLCTFVSGSYVDFLTTSASAGYTKFGTDTAATSLAERFPSTAVSSETVTWNQTSTTGFQYFIAHDVAIRESITYTYARPSSDVTTQWTPSTAGPHYALIDEVTYNDADYIYATAAAQTDEVGLQAMSIPTAGTDVLVNYRVQGITGGGSVTVSLYSGATLVKADTTRTANNTSPAYYTMTVTAAEWGAVAVNWSNMRLRFVSA